MTNVKVSINPCTELAIPLKSGAHPWLQLKSSYLRDIAWVIFSPNLIGTTLGAYTDAGKTLWGSAESRLGIAQTLKELDSDQTYHTYESRPRMRLGHYFESLLRDLLVLPEFQKASHTKYLASNIQVVEGKTTVGEIDFLVGHPPQHTLHIEAAVKFYLLPRDCPNADNPLSWVGPNTRDRLGLKLAHLEQKQLALLEKQPRARQLASVYSESGSDKKIESAFYVKGMLFIHWSSPVQRPKRANRNLLMGHWLHQKDYITLTEHLRREAQNHFLIPLNKNDWMSSYYWNSATLNGQATIAEPSHNTVPKMFSHFFQQLNGEWCEGRILVVPDHWPESNAPSRII